MLDCPTGEQARYVLDHRRAIARRLAILLLLLSGAARDCWADVSCDPDGKRFTYINSEARVGPTAHCHWSDGTDIVVHLVSSGQAPPAASETISIWVNEAKWVDAALVYQFSRVPETYVQTTGITIDAEGMTRCETTTPNDGSSAEVDDSPPVCKTTPVTSLPHDPDRREFPTPGREVPLPPAMTVSQADDEKLCNALLSQIGTRLWDGTLSKAPAKGDFQLGELTFPRMDGGTVVQGAQIVSPVQWDIENTGHPLWVTYLSAASRHSITAYYVFDDDALKHLQASEHTAQDFAHYATRIFPDSLGYCPSVQLPGARRSAQPCYTSEEDLEDLAITPMSFHGASYLLLSKTDDFIAVVKPQSGGKYQEPCQFKMAQIQP